MRSLKGRTQYRNILHTFTDTMNSTNTGHLYCTSTITPLPNTDTRLTDTQYIIHKYKYVCSHTHTHTPSSQHTWKLRPPPSLLILLPPSPPLPLPRSVWRWQSRLPSRSPLLRWECFCFLLFWSADLILARMLHVARCSLSISKCVFLCACLCVCTWMCNCVYALSVYIGVWVALLTSAHTIANVSVKDCPNCRQRKREALWVALPQNVLQSIIHPKQCTLHFILTPTTVQHQKSLQAKESHIKWDRESYCSFSENYFVYCSSNRALANVYNRPVVELLNAHNKV